MCGECPNGLVFRWVPNRGFHPRSVLDFSTIFFLVALVESSKGSSPHLLPPPKDLPFGLGTASAAAAAATATNNQQSTTSPTRDQGERRTHTRRGEGPDKPRSYPVSQKQRWEKQTARIAQIFVAVHGWMDACTHPSIRLFAHQSAETSFPVCKQ